MSTSIIGFGQSTPATNFRLSQVEGAQLPPGGPQPPPATLPAAVADSRISSDTYTQSQAATALLASTAAASPSVPATQPASAPVASPSISAPVVASQPAATQAQNPATDVVAQGSTSDTNYVQQFEQSEAPPPYTLATSAPNPARENRTALAPIGLSPFQIRQFSDLLKSIHSITAAVLPQFSYSA